MPGGTPALNQPILIPFNMAGQLGGQQGLVLTLPTANLTNIQGLVAAAAAGGIMTLPLQNLQVRSRIDVHTSCELDLLLSFFFFSKLLKLFIDNYPSQVIEGHLINEEEWKCIPTRGDNNKNFSPSLSQVPLYNRYEVLDLEGQLDDLEENCLPSESPSYDSPERCITTSNIKKKRRVIIVGDSLLRGIEGPICRLDPSHREVCCLPRAQIQNDERNRRTHTINKWLKGWCHRQNFGFFDHGEMFTAPALLEPNGIHLSVKGKRFLAHELAELVERALN
ncbi:hypothetical protein DUI87_18682 [Hirundo rustica rustica]|uniref:SGNH hydrolase-type esterase domain-containing protein n=1 Tax=Hirundo rustica rustica TaxID=333673 RepID=A0A3M0JX80_HIRRU|nr:hypothetical protein DUI87_18682 [Hirundo rustica rustica]